MSPRWLASNAVLAAVYAGLALALPATAVANYRLTTALYSLAAFNPRLIPGLALGNALAGLPQGPLDIVLGGGVGLLTSWLCSRVTPWASPLAILIVPTLVVPLWLGVLFAVPYQVVVPVLVRGQAASALLAWVVVVPLGHRFATTLRETTGA
ncbi:MAG TPA: QueT transporter family protein [bacterium]|nr:QueT transporter family protein [bacterium]